MAEPTFQQLERRLSRLQSQGISFRGVVYRSSTPQYATETDLLTGEGSRRFGGRWNPVGIAAIYASLGPETAMAEALAHHRYYGIPIEHAMPRTFVAIHVSLRRVLDLREGRIRQVLQVSEKQLLGLDWRSEMKGRREPITQRLGRAVYAQGCEGMLVPSATHIDGHNLLIFPDLLHPQSTIELINPDQLADS